MIDKGRHVRLPANWSLIWEKTPADKAYLIVDGEVSVRKGGNEVARLGPGDVIGEMAIVGHKLRSASVVSLTPLEVIHFTKESLQELIDEVPAFAEAIRDTSRPTGSGRRGSEHARPAGLIGQMAEGTSTGSGDERPDVRHLMDLLEAFLLGEAPSIRPDAKLADDVGIDFEAARRRWRSLGFTAVDEDVMAFTHADEDALRLTEDTRPRLRRRHRRAGPDPLPGSSFARLAEWQMGLLAKQIDLDEMSVEQISEVMAKLVPAVESLQKRYVWRRHTLAVASRLLLAAEREDSDEHEPVEVDDGTGWSGSASPTS